MDQHLPTFSSESPDSDAIILGLAQLNAGKGQLCAQLKQRNAALEEENMKLRAQVAALEEEKKMQTTAPLRIPEGNKLDVLKVLDALAHLKVIHTPDDKPATAKRIMEIFGPIFGQDFSDWSQQIGSAKTRGNADGEAFLSPFREMLTWAEEYFQK